MANLEFEIGDFAPLAGLAIVRTANEDGQPFTTYAVHGSLTPEEAIGMLTAALDQLRYEFVDRDEGQMLDLLCGDEDEED